MALNETCVYFRNSKKKGPLRKASPTVKFFIPLFEAKKG